MPSASGLFLLAIVTQTAAQGKPDILYQVTADYPAGCYGGPGPGEGSNIADLQAPCCIYNVKGYTIGPREARIHRETAGIILNTNREGLSGTMQINVTLMFNLSLLHPKFLGVEVETYGLAHLSIGDETRKFYLSIGELNVKRSYGTGMMVYAPINEAGFIPNKGSVVHIWGLDSLKGMATSSGLFLTATHKPATNAEAVDFFSTTDLYVEERKDGWDYKLEYFFDDLTHKIKDYDKYAIRGYLLDNVVV
ncbi:hypothetical protein Pmar_PMAR028826 [Perkinsus marinus ATCC 50983]|uniref:Uncharacterized protein n=1 Tax=Perkinsus marinus (strain ATCC 50983 / TXsc) TaxID=423536 RepID=C5LJ35_PERM5|nr:hypothetical protein Pmar_PMAR028826 [Perkinsus marinus ATCC 50983]EER03257.1 hypothetical protein Pmar_PMAR028826 [Perkinsus marinus ATCC 50983]|eukprot:XP_002771441.1 hypothetical protein Pmar_PMAR028826 [Perkinsus marinus ATCC 50983]